MNRKARELITSMLSLPYCLDWDAVYRLCANIITFQLQAKNMLQCLPGLLEIVHSFS